MQKNGWNWDHCVKRNNLDSERQVICPPIILYYSIMDIIGIFHTQTMLSKSAQHNSVCGRPTGASIVPEWHNREAKKEGCFRSCGGAPVSTLFLDVISWLPALTLSLPSRPFSLLIWTSKYTIVSYRPSAGSFRSSRMWADLVHADSVAAIVN